MSAHNHRRAESDSVPTQDDFSCPCYRAGFDDADTSVHVSRLEAHLAQVQEELAVNVGTVAHQYTQLQAYAEQLAQVTGDLKEAKANLGDFVDGTLRDSYWQKLAQVQREAGALRQYAQHEASCGVAYKPGRKEKPDVRCTCGLEKALHADAGLDVLTESECQARVDAAVRAERNRVLDAAVDRARASTEGK